jgi:hypothetical protein
MNLSKPFYEEEETYIHTQIRSDSVVWFQLGVDSLFDSSDDFVIEFELG